LHRICDGFCQRVYGYHLTEKQAAALATVCHQALLEILCGTVSAAPWPRHPCFSMSGIDVWSAPKHKNGTGSCSGCLVGVSPSSGGRRAEHRRRRSYLGRIS
jgi:hypothetical protein